MFTCCKEEEERINFHSLCDAMYDMRVCDAMSDKKPEKNFHVSIIPFFRKKVRAYPIINQSI